MLAEISDCVFDIDPLAPEDGLPAYGVHLLGCSGYRVAGNEFIGSDPSAHTAGVLVTASEDGPNRLFGNDFEELHWACLAQGDNRDDTPTTEDAWDVVADYDGLRVLCNTFSGNGYDFSVTLDGQVAAYQGTPNPEALWGILPAQRPQRSTLFRRQLAPHQPRQYRLRLLLSRNRSGSHPHAGLLLQSGGLPAGTPTRTADLRHVRLQRALQHHMGPDEHRSTLVRSGCRLERLGTRWRSTRGDAGWWRH